MQNDNWYLFRNRSFGLNTAMVQYMSLVESEYFRNLAQQNYDEGKLNHVSAKHPVNDDTMN